ncbi:MAG: tetratricopeptide repeat protein [Leptospirales bacterium]|nr:tetratricopeptide repeat protein [Leptospirales bacterium]
MKQSGKFAEAIDFGERLLLREPGHIQNLINLADAHRLNGNVDRARNVINRALTLSPESAQAKRLAGMLRAP